MTDLHDADAAEPGMWASDALLDTIAAGAPVGDDRMSALLSALVSDVSADPLRALPQLTEPARRRRRHRLAPRTGVAGVAVVALLSTGGVAAASVNAGPTSALFPLHRVLTGQPQLDGSQRQALEIKDRLNSAARALASGKVARAEKDVANAESRLPKVAARDGHKALTAEWTAMSRQVKAKVSATAVVKPAATVSPTPTHSATPVHPTSVLPTTTAATTSSSVPGTSAPGTPTSVAPAAGAGPTSLLTTPDPTVSGSATPTPSSVPSTTPSPSGPATSGSPTVTVSATPSAKHHKPGGGGKGSGGTVAPGSPPAPSMLPPSPSGPPVTVPPAPEVSVTVPPASGVPIVAPSPSVAVTPVPSAS
ncbi:MAG: hypothetical protein QOF39_1339 [Frankiales bacterium]|nr:hypothetical protein [Frankiales bacterium]